jgi:hypothetical protein
MAYRSSSSYFETSVTKSNLGFLVNRSIPKQGDDQKFEINSTYNLRPDLLAFDLYNDSDLWWVFAQRNPNTLPDPLFSFVAGTIIFLPKLSVLRETLGF